MQMNMNDGDAAMLWRVLWPWFNNKRGEDWEEKRGGDDEMEMIVAMIGKREKRKRERGRVGVEVGPSNFFSRLDFF